MDHSWAWSRWYMNINQFSWTSLFSGLYPIGLFQADTWDAKVCAPQVQGCYLTFCPVPSCQNTELYLLMVTLAKTAPSLHIPDQSFLFCTYGLAECLSLFSPQSPMLGNCHWCIPETSWIAYALLCCPSRNHRRGESPSSGPESVNVCLLPLVWRRPYILPLLDQTVCSRHSQQSQLLRAYAWGDTTSALFCSWQGPFCSHHPRLFAC